MSTNIEKNINIKDWVSQAEAGRIRKVSRQAINRLVKIGRIRSIDIGGVILVNKEDIKNFEPKKSGRTKKA